MCVGGQSGSYNECVLVCQNFAFFKAHNYDGMSSFLTYLIIVLVRYYSCYFLISFFYILSHNFKLSYDLVGCHNFSFYLIIMTF